MYHIQLISAIYVFLLMSCNNKTTSITQVAIQTPEIEYYWTDLTEQDELPVCEGRIMPLKYRLMTTDYHQLRKLLLPESGMPVENSSDTINLLIPLPDGSWESYNIHYVEVMAPELAAKFPEIRTYAGASSTNSADQIRLDISPRGFSSMILSERGTMMIDPFCPGDTLHIICYNKNDLPPDSKQHFEK